MSIENYVDKVKQLATEDEACALISEVVENPQIFVFGELLELPLIQALRQQAHTAKWYNLLELFAYGKLSDYDDQTMPTLTELMVKKLRLLTIVTLATNKSKKIPYSVLSKELQVTNLRDLEDAIIEAIYANLIRGKLDQKAICLEIESTLARDVRFDKVDEISSVLSSWISNCESILSNIEKQTKTANLIKQENFAKKIELEDYINVTKKSIKASNQEIDETWEVISMQQNELDKAKRGYKPPKFPPKNRNQRS